MIPDARITLKSTVPVRNIIAVVNYDDFTRTGVDRPLETPHLEIPAGLKYPIRSVVVTDGGKYIASSFSTRSLCNRVLRDRIT